jgi:outer membrane receptor protein involved in Fe transport
MPLAASSTRLLFLLLALLPAALFALGAGGLVLLDATLESRALKLEPFNTNLGSTLQQLPGLSVNESADGEPSGVNIRSLEAKYNSVPVDGNRMPASGNSRAFSISQLNADSVSHIEVIKAATPGRDGDALGGIINVISRSVFQREGRAVEIAGGGLRSDKREKWNYNAAPEYAGGGFRARLSCTYRSDFLGGLDANEFFDDYFGAYESLNRESSCQLNRSTRLFLNVNNLTAAPQISYQGRDRPDNPEDCTTSSWRATAGGSPRF